jgi:CHAT domain-containing protein
LPKLQIGITAGMVLFLSLTPCMGSKADRSTVLAAIPSQEQQQTATQYYQQGIAQYQASQIDRAIQSWQQALQLFRQAHDQAGELSTLGALSAGHIAIGDYRQTIHYAQQQQAIAQAINNPSAQAQALGNLGAAYKNLGDYPKALATHQQALILFRELKDRKSEGILLRNLGNTYSVIGDYDQALPLYQKSLAIAQELKNPREEGNTLATLGAIHTNLGNDRKALQLYQKGLAIAERLQDLPLQANILINLGTTYHVLGLNNQGIKSYQQGLELAQQLNDRVLQGEVLSNLGLIYEDQHDYDKAIQTHQQSVMIAQSSRDPHAEALARNNLGHALLADHKLKAAEDQLRIAVKLLDQARSGLSDLARVNLLDTQVSTYNLLQQILIASNNPEAALEASEQGRAQAFAHQLAQHRAASGARSLAVNLAPNLAQIKQIAQQQKITIVEYALLPDDAFQFRGKQRGRSAGLYIWVVQPTGKVHFRYVDLTFLWKEQQDFKHLVAAARCTIKRSADPKVCGPILSSLRQTFPPRDEQPYNPALQQLHELLITPIADLLPSNPDQTVVFVPQENLFVLPFAALQDRQGRYLIERHTLVHAPSIQVLNLAAARQIDRPNPTALIVGNPVMPQRLNLATNQTAHLAPLPFAEVEAIAIAKQLKVPVLTQAAATKPQVMAQMPQAKLIHLATHGLLDDLRDSGIPGAIALAPTPGNDGFLTSDEIAQLQLQADLVVLSACNTGEGTISGDGVIGLSRAFMTAGASRVMVSLWQVPDDSTAELMQHFYRDRQRLTQDAQALRSAMLETMKSYPEPLNWAPFLIMGSDRR